MITAYIPDDSSEILEKFIKCIMKDGKKSVARQVMKDALAELKKSGQNKPIDAFEAALRKVTPFIEVRPKRIGGAVYQIPMEIKPNRQRALGIRWVINAARKRKGMPMYKRLFLEFKDALNEQGEAYKKKIDVKKMAEANKAFAHFANY